MYCLVFLQKNKNHSMNNLERISNKIVDRQKLINLLSIWNFQDKKIVFTNGCFDILHLGHIDYLSKAKDQGQILIIGVNTDNSVKRLKGKNRPITDENSRATILASLQFVDTVILFDEDTPYELIKFVQPDVLVKGSDYKPEDIVGYDIVKAKNGNVVTIDFLEGYSTTAIENKIRR
jgi:rfaE bifunctional protein nucleotidyltransferase chain/domain